MRHIIIVILMVCLSSGTAFAKKKRGLVQQLNDEGITAFEAGNYELAAKKFFEAWNIDSDPTLRKNEAIAWFKADKCKEASEASASYLDSGAADKETRSEMKSILANCRVTYAREAANARDFNLAENFLVEAEEFAETAVPRENIKLARLEIAQIRDEYNQEIRRRAKVEPTTTESAASWPAVVAGTGAVILTSAIVYHIIAATYYASEYDNAANQGTDRARYDDLADSLDTARWLVPTLYAIGATTTGIGVWFLYNEPADTSAAPSSGGVTFSGHF